MFLPQLFYQTCQEVQELLLLLKWAAADIDAKWAASGWAKKLANKERRSQLSDFERFQVMVLKKQRRFATKKALVKA